MKNIFLTAVFLATITLSVSSFASEITNTSLQKLLLLSGVHNLVSQIPGMLQVEMENARKADRFSLGTSSIPANYYRAKENDVVTAFRPAVLIQAISIEMKRYVSEEDAKKMLAWYDSELGKRLVKLEQNNTSPEAGLAMETSVQSLLKDKQRVIFAMKLDNLLHMTDMATRFQLYARFAMVTAFQYRKYVHKLTKLKELKKTIAGDLQKKRYRIRRSVIISTVYTYNKIGLKDLERYQMFLKSHAAQRFNKALMAGMNDGMHEAINNLIHLIERKS